MCPPTPPPLAQPPELPGTQPAASPGVRLTSQLIPCLFSHSPGHPPRTFMQDRIPTPTLGLGPGPSVPTKAWEVVSAAQATPGLPGMCQPCLLQGHDGGCQPRSHGLGSELLRPQNWVTGRQGAPGRHSPE